MPKDDSAIAPRLRPLPGRRSPAAVYALLLAGAFLVYAAANAVVPVAGELRAGLGMAGSGAALFLLPFAAGFGVGSFVWFATARHRPPRLLLPLALAIVAVASVPVMFPAGVEFAVGARFLVGLGAAGYPAVAQTVITRAATPNTRGRLIGGFVMAVVAGSFAGQAIAGAIADLVSVEAALALVCVVGPLLVAVALWRFLADVPAAAPAHAAAGTRPGHVHLPGLLRRQWPVLVVAFLSFGGYWMLMSQLPVALRDDRFDLTAAQAGAVSTIGLFGIVTAWATGRMADHHGQRLPLVATLGLGIAGLALTLPAGGPLWVFAVGCGAFLAAYWGYMPPASAEVAARSDTAERQPALMAFYAAMWSGAALAPGLGAALPTWTAAAAVVLAAWAGALVVGALMFRTARGVDTGRDDEGSGPQRSVEAAARAR